MVTRYQCLSALAPLIGDSLVILGVGGVTEEWNSLRPSDANFDSASMGTAASLGLGLALALPQRQVVALDGDGGFLMNLSALASLGNLAPENLLVVIFDNECYDCIGGPPTATAGNVDLAATAAGAGIKNAQTVQSEAEFRTAVETALKTKGFSFIVAKVEPGTRKSKLKDTTRLEEKFRFIRYLEQTEGIKILTQARQTKPGFSA
jgi:thiamine pyrophosphate-dependent acetolactate synthase large subunit-like protein